MKLIIAVIRPHRLDEVRKALEEMGIMGLTVSEVQGHGRQKGHSEVYRGAEYQVNLLPKLKLEVAVTAALVPRAVEAISVAARTDAVGDGKIFVLPIESATRIRTGETGDTAL